MQFKTICKAIFFSRRALCILFVLLCSYLPAWSQPGHNPAISQRFLMQVEDLLDLGFINENKAYTNTDPKDIEEIMSGRKPPEYEFRIRTNEPFKLTIQTYAEDSTGNIDADSLLQVNFLVNGDGEEGNDAKDYQDITGKPVTLIEDNSQYQGKTFKIKYRAKPGGTIPKDIKKLDLIFTASYP